MAYEYYVHEQQVQERITAEMRKLMTTISSMFVMHDDMSNFKQICPSPFSGYYNPEKAKKWILEMETAFDSLGCAEKRNVRLATLTLVEEAENWWNLTKPSMPTTESVILWDTFKDKFLENYAPSDLSKKKAKGKQVMRGPECNTLNFTY